MPVYHQMGNDSENLLVEEHLARYQGAILSPINYAPGDVEVQISDARERPDFETIFDPQLYAPQHERGCLPKWGHFPRDVETADTASEAWWDGVAAAVADVCRSLAPSAACSPAFAPQAFTDDYFALAVRVGSRFTGAIAEQGIRPFQTALVGLPDLATPGRPQTIGSILSQAAAESLYLVLVSDTNPRRELADVESLKGAMRLVSLLSSAGMSVLVGFSSSDVVLWKAAGAASCATGKFFNLRRWTRSRFDDSGPAGGGQEAYWFEESLMAFLRESDLVRVRQRGMLGAQSCANPYGQQILERLDGEPGAAWVGLGWRQFMYWFADMEGRIAAGDADAERVLAEAEGNWGLLDEARVLMAERQNNGSWLRSWRRALIEYQMP